jgi:selenocysteine-specific elongation factor
MDAAAPLTLGTAGHIDHGKTALIGALTGKHTDRLPEERERGISIELGYAPLELPGGRRLSVVDVPGHERFVRTMVAGATGVDMFLLCVAADDGVMPQTREHMEVLRGLGVEMGVIAITKCDTGAPDLAAEEASELWPGAPVVRVSARDGAGLAGLLAAIDAVAARLPNRSQRDGPTRLHVDRSFTLRGIGTVVTGTLWAGSIAAGDSVRILPRGLEARVRSVQVHDQPVERAAAGQRVALNLNGVGWREVGRGDVVVEPGSELAPHYLLDVCLRLPGELERGTRVQVHHGTREAPARVYPLGDGFAQLRLEAPLVAAAGDRLVVRQIAPPDTLGGGTVIDPAARKHGPSDQVVERLAALQRGERPPQEPESPPPATRDPRPATPLDDAALHVASLLRSDGREPRAHGDLATAAGLAPTALTDRLTRLEQAGQAVRVGKNLHFHPDPLAELEARVVALCERDGAATIATVRDELGTSRRYAQAVLEHLDGAKVTRRDGDAHVLRRR